MGEDLAEWEFTTSSCHIHFPIPASNRNSFIAALMIVICFTMAMNRVNHRKPSWLSS
ncbi:unnamed protein product [marine sediment metagenome]|uniref:Uncharacterized protein n=1 Tax=marine sediment metagenome TaxID=412755 RepID=X1VEU4_9ZZZZ